MDEDKNQKPNLSPPPNLPSIPPPSSPGRPFPSIPPPVSKPLSPPPLLPTPPKISLPSSTPPILPPRLPGTLPPKPESEKPVIDAPKKSVPESAGGFSSSIRTMQGDIDSILKGKKPAGETFEKKMEGAIKAPPPPPPLPPVPTAPKGPLVKLGETQKAKPIFPPSVPGVPSAPKPEEKKIAVPPPGRSVISKQVILLLALIIAAGGFSYWFFIFRQPEPEMPVVEITPTLTPVPFEPSPPVIKLGGDPFEQLNDFVNNTFVDSGEIRVVDVIGQLGQDHNFNTFFQSFSVNLPQDIINNLDIDSFGFLLFGQTENFGSKVINKRYGFIVEATSEVNLIQSLRNWEPVMPENLGTVLNLNTSNPQAADFQDNFFGGAAIRYKNFPAPDETIDYAVISGTNGKKYFVFTNSRESMYSVIDNLNVLLLPFMQSFPPPTPTQ